MYCTRVVFALSLLLGVACSDDDPVTPPADATAAAVDADPNQPDAMPGSAIGYLQPCDITNDLCDTSQDLSCFPFNMKGPHCTHTCVRDQADDDCEAPSPGCSGMGVCKVPD